MDTRAGQGVPGEERCDRRSRVLKGARIIFNGGYSVYDSRVRNLSTGGALLQLPSTVGIPARFEIAIDGMSARPCTAVWRTDTLIGVAFDDANGNAA